MSNALYDIAHIFELFRKVLTSGVSWLQSFADAEAVELSNIGNSNINLVIRVRHRASGRTVLLKYAPPFVACLGPNYLLSSDRAELEFKALRLLNELHANCAVQPLALHDSLMGFVMEDLADWQTLRCALMSGQFEPAWFQNLAITLATVQLSTHRRIASQRWEALRETFHNQQLLSLHEEIAFKRPFSPDLDADEPYSCLVARGQWPISNELRASAALLHSKFIEQSDSFQHGDMHTSSIMVRAETVMMFDAEFAFFGPMGYDMGHMLAHLILAYYYLQSKRDGDAAEVMRPERLIQENCQTFLQQYSDMLQTQLTTHEVQLIISEVAGYAGCEILRRLLIRADRIPDMELAGHDFAREDAFEAGSRLVNAWQQIQSPGHLVFVAFALC